MLKVAARKAPKRARDARTAKLSRMRRDGAASRGCLYDEKGLVRL